MKQRTAEINRTTKETEIAVRVTLEGGANGEIDTGVGFLNHMLELVKVHAGLDLELRCRGDLEVDFHHTVEDAGICLGKALAEALGDKAGIERFADRVVPMDDCAALVALDLSGRPALLYDVPGRGGIGGFDFELVEEFFRALSNSLGANIYIKALKPGNLHHMAECIFKAFARCLRDAARVTGCGVPSSKGCL